MEFKNMKQRMIDHFNTALGSEHLFEVELDKDELWNLYLDSFPEGTNPIFRERRYYDCSCCRQFIKNIGPTVFIDKDLNLHTIFEFDTHDPVTQPVMNALDRYVKNKTITDVYLNETSKVGTDKSHEHCDDGKIFTWDHFFLELPDRCVLNRYQIPTMKGRLRDRRNVFKRSLDEISMSSLDTVLELIDSNTLYKGAEWKSVLTKFREYKDTYESLPFEKRELYTWRESMLIGDVVGKIRNHSIGVLLVDITEGMELDAAVRRYEQIVAPTNYKRPKAIFTKKMLEDAKKTITELGYMESLARRFATLDDITVNNILFSNRDAAKRIGGDIFDEMMSEAAIDLDAHCFGPRDTHIWYGQTRSYVTGGFLDVDIIHPERNKAAVENIAWADKNRMVPGEYRFYVHQFNNRGGKDGFRAEIEFDGQIYQFNYDKELRQGEKIPVATVTLDQNGKFTITEHLKSSTSSREVWGLKTNTFVPVTVAMYSPNYWDDQQGVGHRHYFFMMKDCVNPEQPNGFYNEFLDNKLDQHKRVFEALGSKLAVASADDQLSGLGFSSTKRNELVVKVKGATERIFKIKF